MLPLRYVGPLASRRNGAPPPPPPPLSVEYVSSASSVSYYPCPAPTDVQAGDRLLAMVTMYTDLTATSTIEQGNGWSLITRVNNASSDFKIVTEIWETEVAWPVPSSFTAAVLGAPSDYYGMVLSCYRNVQDVSLVDAGGSPNLSQANFTFAGGTAPSDGFLHAFSSSWVGAASSIGDLSSRAFGGSVNEMSDWNKSIVAGPFASSAVECVVSYDAWAGGLLLIR